MAVLAGLAIAGAAAGAAKELTWKKRARKQLGMQMDYEKEMTKFQRDQQMKLWEDTNYKAQMEQMRKAGLNPGLMYEGGGQGGQTTPAGGASADVPENDGMGLQMGAQSAMQAAAMKAQIDLTKAQTEKTRIEAENIGEGGVQRESIRSTTNKNNVETAIREIERKYTEMQQAWKTTEMEGKAGISQIQARTLLNTQDDEIARIKELAKQADKSTAIMEAEKVIKEFEAQLAKDGIPPNSPWYAKLLGDLLNKIGVMDWINHGKGTAKEAVKPK